MDRIASGHRLFEAKYRIPTLAQQVLSRPRLYAQLDDARDCKLVVVSAPAGFGKTTLVASWLLPRCCHDSRCAGECGGFQGAWLSLDERENNLAAFAANLAGALESACHCLQLDVANFLQLPAIPPVSAVAHAFVEDLARQPHPITLTLDDYHVIREPVVHELLRLLIDYSPDDFRLIIIARHDPPLPIAKLVLQGKARQIRMNELRFDHDEAYAFLDLVLGDAVPPESRAAVVEQAEGWVAHLGLGAILLRQSPDQVPADSAHNLAVSYLVDDLLAIAPSEARAFLLATSVLERFCAPLANAMLARPYGASQLLACANGREPVHVFRQIVEEGLFLAQLDATRTWYRYHDLFRELLLQRLRHEYPGEELIVRRRAFEWLKGQGYVEEAIAQAQALGDEEALADVVETYILDALQGFQWQTLTRWLDLIPPRIMRVRPVFLVAYGFSLINAGSIDRLGKVLQWFEAHEQQAAIASGVNLVSNGFVEVLRSEYAYCLNDVDASLAHGHKALELLSPENQFERGVVAVRLNSVLAHKGKSEDGRNVLRAFLRHAVDDTSPMVVRVRLSLALSYARSAELGHAKRELELIEQMLDVRQPYNECWLNYSLGRIAYEWGELDTAITRLTTAAQSHGGNIMRACEALLNLGLAYQAGGKEEEADRSVDEALALARSVRSEDLAALAFSVRTRLLLMRGQPQLTPATHSRSIRDDRMVLYMPIELPRLTEARRLIALGQRASLAGAQGMLEEAVGYFEAAHTLLLLVPALALLALLYRARDQKSRALATLARAVQLGAAGGFIRSFLDLGPDLVGLLYELKLAAPLDDYVADILAAAAKECRPRSPARTRHVLVEALTNRELAVLELLGQNLSDKEIGARLVISPLTVRKHTANIFAKLQVRNRRHAATRARDLGLIRPDTPRSS